MAKEKKTKCPYCGSTKLGQPTSNYIGRTASYTAGYVAGAALGTAGTFISFGTIGNKVAHFVASNVIEPIGEIVPRKYKCKCCGREFE